MNIDDIDATQLDDKNIMTESPEVDEDACTESSEGSNAQQQNEAADSEDEFVDAVELPSSTSGILLAFDAAPPPLSGVYEDAMEATEEQVMAALGSTGSGGSQSTICEEDENEAGIKTEPENTTEITGVEEEAVAVVEKIMETVATAKEDLTDHTEEDVAFVVEDADEEAPTQQKTLNDAIDEMAQMNSNNEVDRDSEVVEAAGSEESTDVKDEPAELEAVPDAAMEEDLIDKVVADSELLGADVNEGVENESDDATEVIAQNVLQDEPVVDQECSGKECSGVSDEAVTEEIHETNVQVVDGDETARDYEEEVEMVNDQVAEDEVAPEETEAIKPTKQEVGVAEVVTELSVSDAAHTNSQLLVNNATELVEDVVKPKDEAEVNISGDEFVIDDGSVLVDPTEEVTDIGENVAAGNGNTNDIHENDETDLVVKEGIAVAIAEHNDVNGSEHVEVAVLESVHKSASAVEEIEPEGKYETQESVQEDSQKTLDDEAVYVAKEDAIEDDDTENAIQEEVVEDRIESPDVGSEDEQVHGAKSDANPDEKLAEVPDEIAAQPEEVENGASDKEATVEVDKVVTQVTDELVDAVLLEHTQTEKSDEVVVTEEVAKENLVEAPEKSAPESVSEVSTNEEVNSDSTNVLEPEDEAASTGKVETEVNPVNNNAEHLDVEADTVATEHALEEDTKATSAAAESTTKEATASSCRKSSDDHEQSHGVVLGLLPRLEPSSGTTTTTTIEPFVLSSESNEMMEMHVPPQRWVYEVYGFSIENRVVYYHIHKSDRSTGIRHPPILKRYTDFRELQIQLLDTCIRAAADMPRIPKPHLGTVFRGYKSKKTIEIRERAFRALLRYIAQYPVLHGSVIFERFITTSRAMSGTGWM